MDSQIRKSIRARMPDEAVEIYNLYIHSVISRRAFMDNIKKFAVGGLTVSAVVEALMPDYAAAQQVARDDDRIHASYETIPSPMGNGYIRGYLVRPVSADTREAKIALLPGIIVVHENRGLNPHIEDIARRVALADFMAFAPDGLSSMGGYPGDDYEGGQMFAKINGAKMLEDFIAAALWLKGRPDCTGKIGATGFCYGGGVANQLAAHLGPDIQASVPYYGGPPTDAQIANIKAAIMVHHGALDTRLASTWPAYHAKLDALPVPNEGHIWPNAVHGFNCDATPERYNKEAADQAWTLTIGWFNKYVRGTANPWDQPVPTGAPSTVSSNSFAGAAAGGGSAAR